MTVTGRVGGGGLGPSNAAAAPRALLLIAVAVILGLILLWKGLDTTPGITVSPEATDDGSAESVGMVDEGQADLLVADEPVATPIPVQTPTPTTTNTTGDRHGAPSSSTTRGSRRARRRRSRCRRRRRTTRGS